MKKTVTGKIESSVFSRLLLLLSIASAIFVCTITATAADVAISSGTFVDSQGAQHPWHVNAQHALIWGGRPWIPAGGLFQSRYLTGPQTDDNWAADQADLTKLKEHGIHSLVLLVSSGRDPITDLPPADLQRVLDYLDQQGFQYGLTLSSFPRDPVEATIVNPALYRVASPSPGSVTYFRNLTGLTGATFFLVSQADGSVISSGDATVVDPQSVSVTLKSTEGGAGTVLLLYPRRLFLPESLEGAHLPDIWGQADSYRDNLLLYFSKIKFGPGLRFFLDPVVSGLGYYGDADAGAIPVGDAYRFQFQVWLEQRYGKSLPRLNGAWGVKNQDIFDFPAASRCYPLWRQTKGIQLLVDPVSNKTFEAVALGSQYWQDVEEFRADSMRGVMNNLAIAIKNGIADVPVVYRWTRPSKLYLNASPDEGYDGLMVSSTDHGDVLARNSAGWALAEAEQSGRSVWLLGELSPTNTTSSGYNSKSDLLTDTRELQSLAFKGYFVNNFRRLPLSDWTKTSLLDAPPEQLDWIHADEANYSVSGDSLADFVPNILYFPINLALPTTSIRQFDDGTWWLPSYHTGDSIDIGRGLSCYLCNQPGSGDSLVLWSPDGTVTSAPFELPKKTAVTSTTPGGRIVTITLNKGVYTFQTSKTPIVIHGVNNLPLVADATLLELVESQKLIDSGQAQNIPMDVYEQRLYYIKNEVLSSNDPVHQHIAYPLLAALNNELESELDPNAWVEGEAASQQNFGTVVASPSAAGGAFLWQDTNSPPVSDDNPYEATYTLNVGAPGDYTVWASLAPGPPGQGAASPLSFSLDSGTRYDVSRPEASGQPYGSVLDAATIIRTGSFCWYRLGVLTLTSGVHSLNFLLTGPAPDTHRYTLGIDAICLSRGSFYPNGPVRPAVH